MDDASLDDFLDDGEDGEDTDTGESEDSATRDTDTGESNSGPPTSRWRPEGTACAVCAESATRLWQQDGRLVCSSCKAWEYTDGRKS